MAFKKVASEKRFLGGYEEKGTGNPRFKKGQVLCEGFFVGESVNKFNPQRPNYDFKCQTEDGREEIVVLNGSGKLKVLMDQNVNEGDYCRITYDGKKILTSGDFKGSGAHQFILEIDEDRSKRLPTVKEIEGAKNLMENRVDIQDEDELNLEDFDD